MRVKSYSLGIVLVGVVALSLAGCKSGSGSSGSSSSGTGNPSSSSTDTTVNLTGSVGDGPVVGAQLSVRASSGQVLQNAVSDQQAGYDITFKTQGKYYPLLVSAQGGTDLVTNRAPDFTLKGAAVQPGAKAVTNLNPFTTLAIAVAQQMSGGLTDSNIQSALTTVVAQFNSGLTSLASSGAMSTPIDDSNLAEIVKSSETLAEILRRTNAQMIAARGSFTIADVIDALAADLTDGKFDGQGAPGTDPEVSAVATLVSAQVLLESMDNALQVGGQDATAALDSAINKLASSPATAPTAQLPVTAAMIDEAKRGVAAANAIAPSNALQNVLAELGQLSGGMSPAAVAAIVPSTAPASLDSALTRLQSNLASDVTIVDRTLANGAPASSGTNTPPTIAGSPPTSVVAGTAYGFTPQATDADGDTLTFSIANKPSWASFSTSTGRLSGTPASAAAGAYSNITISVSDGQASASLAPFSVTVSAPTSANTPPTIAGSPPTSVVAGTAYSFTPQATDPDGDTLTFSITNQPSWASFDTATGKLSGTPSAADVSTYSNVTISVSDGQASASLSPFSIAVQAAGAGSATLSWTAPTQNTDGTPLTDLAGYKVYWGTSSGNYSNSVTLNNPGLTSYVVSGLASGNTYYFSIAAFNSSGVQSALSNEASKAIP